MTTPTSRSARIATGLRFAGLALVLATAATWLATGAHAGWTQTSVVTMHHDEITGIEYPLRQDKFVAGLELLAAGTLAAAAFAGAARLLGRRSR